MPHLDYDEMPYIKAFMYLFIQSVIHSGNTDINMIQDLHSPGEDLRCMMWSIL